MVDMKSKMFFLRQNVDKENILQNKENSHKNQFIKCFNKYNLRLIIINSNLYLV